MSNGAFFSYRLACELSDRIASIAPVAGGMGVDCRPLRPVPTLAIHGLNDNCVPFAGGHGNCFEPERVDPAVFASLGAMAYWNRCRAPWWFVLLERRGKALHLINPTCPPTGKAELWAILDGGHTYPGGEPNHLPFPTWPGTDVIPTRDILANDVIWQFFVEHPQP
jgi:polyhydroxybutyrate depolymerase